MPDVTPCPAPADLQRYMLGAIPEASASAIDAHLEKCASCVHSLDGLPAKDALLEVVQASGRMRRPRNVFIEGLVQKLDEMSRTILPKQFAAQQEAPSQSAANGDTIPSATAASVQATSGPDSVQLTGRPPDDPRDYLAPAQAPDEMGRLGGYRVLKVLGSGGMGVVFLAEDMQLRRRIALKVMRPSIAASPEARQRFVKEAQATAAIEHEHIIAIHQVHEDRGVPFLAMPLLQGETLEERLRRETKLTPGEAMRIAREIAEGLAAAHDKGLIHRDIKPVNVWLTQGGRVKVLDFGLARSLEGDLNLTQTGAIVGTPAYMAPEQARGETVDGRSDLFSLGCVLYRMLTGERPFKGATPMAQLRSLEMDQPPPPNQLNLQVTPALSDLVMRLLAKNPAERLGSARLAATALHAVEGEQNTMLLEPAYPVAIPVAASDWSAVLKIPAHWKRRLLTWQTATLAAGMLLALTGLSAGGLAYVIGHRPPATTSGKPGPKNESNVPPSDKEVIARLKRDQETNFTSLIQPLDSKPTGKALNIGSLVTAPVKIKDVDTWTIDTEKYSAAPTSIRFFGNGRRLDFSSPQHSFYSLEKKDYVPAPRRGAFVELSPDDSRWVDFAGGSQRVTVGLTSEEKDPEPILGFPNGVKQATWHPAGKILAVVELDGKVTLCDGVAASKLTGCEWKPPNANASSVYRWSPDGNSLVHFATNSETCHLLDADKGTVYKTITVPELLADVKWSPDSSMLALRGRSTLYIWRLEPLKQLAQFPAVNIAWRTDSKALAYARDTKAHLYDLAKDKDVATYSGHQNEVTFLEFAPGGKTLLTIAADKTIRFWEVETGQQLGTILCLTTGRALALSANGYYAGTPGVEEDFFYVYRQQGQNRTCTPEQFRMKFDWHNDRDGVNLFAK